MFTHKRALKILLAVGCVLTLVAPVGVAAADPILSVEHDQTVSPGEETTIVVSGEAGRLTVTGDTTGWVVNQTSPATLLTTPSPANTPVESGAGATWGHVFASAGPHTFEIVVTAPDEPGIYTFTAEAATESGSVSQSFMIEVAAEDGGGVSVEAPERVAPDDQTTIAVTGSDTGHLTIAGDTVGWVVNDTLPASLLTVPSPGETPYVSEHGDTWGHVFDEVGEHTFQVVVTAPDEAGRYTFVGSSESASETFTIRVGGETHASGVSMRVWRAVAGDDGELSRDEIQAALSAYVNGRSVDGVALSRSDVLALVQWYVMTG